MQRRQQVGLPERVTVRPGLAQGLHPLHVVAYQAVFHRRRHHPVGLPVVQERGQIVLPRRQQCVLEVDDRHRAAVHHEVPTVVVPVVQHPRLPGQMLRHGLEGRVQHLPFRFRKAPLFPLLQAVLREVGQLPEIEPPIERLPERHAAIVPPPGALHLQHQQLVDGLLVPPDRFGLRRLPHPVPQAHVPQVLQQHQPLVHPMPVDLRHPHPDAFEEPVHVQERQLLRRLLEHRQLVRRHRQPHLAPTHHHHRPPRPRPLHRRPEVAPRRRVPRQRMQPHQPRPVPEHLRNLLRSLLLEPLHGTRVANHDGELNPFPKELLAGMNEVVNGTRQSDTFRDNYAGRSANNVTRSRSTA